MIPRWGRSHRSGQRYTQNGVETLAIPMDDYGRTQLTEELLQSCFDFISIGLQERGHALAIDSGRLNLGLFVAVEKSFWSLFSWKVH